MSEKQNRSSVSLDVSVGASQAARTAAPEDPFRMLILGDFSGRKNRGLMSSLAGRRSVAVDRDNLDDILSAMRVSLRLAGTEIPFAELDDFHPDSLHSQLAVFRDSPPAHEEEILAAGPTKSGADVLNAILGDEPVLIKSTPPTDDLAELIRRALVGAMVTKDDASELERRSRVEAFHGELMRAFLHHPDFQALEAAWRGLDLLVRGLDTDGALKLYLFDATLEELVADTTGLETLLAGQGEPWAVTAANFAFGRSAKDISNLSRFAKLAQAGGAPFLAESEVPSSDPALEWPALRRSAEAQWLGLALPRFLMRLPYGKDTSPIESFAFEEMLESEHTHYLWGNPAFCCALLLGQSFLDHGWEMRPGSHKQISPLPQHMYREDGQLMTKPCAELWMTDSLAETLMEEGIMPLASLKNQDAALLVRFQSIAEPLAPLSGRW